MWCAGAFWLRGRPGVTRSSLGDDQDAADDAGPGGLVDVDADQAGASHCGYPQAWAAATAADVNQALTARRLHDRTIMNTVVLACVRPV